MRNTWRNGWGILPGLCSLLARESSKHRYRKNWEVPRRESAETALNCIRPQVERPCLQAVHSWANPRSASFRAGRGCAPEDLSATPRADSGPPLSSPQVVAIHPHTPEPTGLNSSQSTPGPRRSLIRSPKVSNNWGSIGIRVWGATGSRWSDMIGPDRTFNALASGRGPERHAGFSRGIGPPTHLLLRTAIACGLIRL